MFVFKGGQKVKRGIYWDLEHDKVILKEDGYLPGMDKETYFRLPESYLLIIVLLLGLALSMVFPYGIGIIVFFGLIALTSAICSGVSAFCRLLRKKL